VDSSFFGVEELSGLTLQSQATWQTNYVYWNDTLITVNQTSQYGQFAPLVIVQKTNTMTTDQVNALLNGILKAMSMKTVVFLIFLILGVAILGAGVFMCIKSRQLFNATDGEAKPVNNSNVDAGLLAGNE